MPSLSRIQQPAIDTSAQYMGFKNRIINGGFSVAQRGASISGLGVGGSNYYGLDRWGGFRGAYATGLDVSRQAGFNGQLYCMRIQRTSGNTNSSNGLYVAQVIETLNCADLAGQAVTLSFSARAGANYSGGALSVTVQTSGTTDDTFNNLTSGTFSAGSFSASPTITTTGTVYTASGTIPSNAKTIAIQIGFTPSGTAGANDYVEITGVQLEKGSTATSFDYRPYGTELALCQRYLPAFKATAVGDLIGPTYNANATIARCTMAFPVQPRTAPTGLTVSAASDFVASSNTNMTGSSIVISAGGPLAGLIQVTGAGGQTAGQGGYLYAANANAQILWTGCEL